MQLTLLQPYPDRVGRSFTWCGFGTGPASYTGGNAGGDAIVLPGYQNYIESIFGAISVSGTYRAEGMPSSSGPRPTWKLRYTVVATGAEVANTTNLSAEVFQLSGFGGPY